MSACLFANLSFFICFDILRISETAVSDSDFYLLLKFYKKSILLIFSFLISYLFCFFLFCFEVLPYFCTGIGKKDK